MKCKHCGKELIAVTMYIEAGAFNVAAAPVVPNTQQSTDGVAWWSLGAAAVAPAAPTFTTTLCQHEPAIEPPNAAGGNYE